MNNEISTTENDSKANDLDKPGEPEKSRPSAGGAGLAWLSLLVALSSLGASGWLWWQGSGAGQDAIEKIADDLNRQEQRLAKADERVSAVESQVSDLRTVDSERRLRDLEQLIGSVKQSNAAWQAFESDSDARLRSMQAELENAKARLASAETRLSMVSARSVNSSAELDLAEVDYLLRLAQERLALFADAKSADRALEIAGRHIAAFDNPMYLGVEQEIAAARQKLSLLHPLDYQQLERKLDVLQTSLASLSFKGEGTISEQQQDAGSGLWSRIRNAFSGLVTVHRSTSEEEQLPVLADQELIRQRAWLQLEVARYAAARRDQKAYTAALDRFSNMLQRWFEPPGGGVMDNLSELHQQNVDPSLPDISAPWAALRALQGISDVDVSQ